MTKLLFFLAVIVTFMSLSSFCDNSKCKAHTCAKKVQMNYSQKKSDVMVDISPLFHLSEI